MWDEVETAAMMLGAIGLAFLFVQSITWFHEAVTAAAEVYFQVKRLEKHRKASQE